MPTTPDSSEKSNLHSLLTIAAQEEWHYIEMFSKTRGFYAGLVLALLALSGGGVMEAAHWFHLTILLIPVAIAALLCIFAIAACDRYYTRFLEAITTRAKIEYKLSLTPEIDGTETAWYATEKIVAERHMVGRTFVQNKPSTLREHWKYFTRPSLRTKNLEWRNACPNDKDDASRIPLKDSEEFLCNKMPLGDNFITKQLFSALLAACLIFALYITLGITLGHHLGFLDNSDNPACQSQDSSATSIIDNGKKLDS